MTFSEWLNKTSMSSFRSFVMVFLFCGVITFFTAVSGKLMLDNDARSAINNPDPAIRAAIQVSESSHHNYGMQLATAIITLMGIAIGVNAASQFGDRITAREHVEAKERGRIGGAAIAASVKNGQGGVTTKEYPATEPRPSQMVQVNLDGGE